MKKVVIAVAYIVFGAPLILGCVVSLLCLAAVLPALLLEYHLSPEILED
jgi:hypothetical protein